MKGIKRASGCLGRGGRIGGRFALWCNVQMHSKQLFLKKCSFLTGLLLACFLVAKPQLSTADSLKKVLVVAADDTARAKILNKIGVAYFYTSSDSAMHYARYSHHLARGIGFKVGEWQSLNLIGNILKNTGNFPLALETHLTVLQMGEALNDETYIAISYNNIAEVYKEQGEYKNALEYYYKARDIFQKQKSPYLVNAFLNIGDNYEVMNQTDSALMYQNLAYQLALQEDDQDNIGPILTNLGNINFKIGQKVLARSYYLSSLPYAMAADDKQTLFLSYLGLARVFKEEGALDSALYYSKQALGAAHEIADLKGISQCASFISALYDATNNTDSAYKYFRLATVSNDSMFSQEKVRAVQRLNFNEQLRQEKIEEALLREQEQRAYDLQMLAIVIFIVTFFVALILISKQKVRSHYIKYAGLFGLLLLFEFISVYLHPYIADFTHHVPVYMLSITVAIAALLVPLHHKMEEWVNRRLVRHRRGRPRKSDKPPATGTEKAEEQ